MFGYAGKILRVDLSSGSVKEISTAAYSDRFLGGKGLAAKIYWDEVPPETKALDPGNRLIFATGPLVGLPALGSSRWIVAGKSPFTSPDQFCTCCLGGTWGAELKFAGCDAIVVQGKSDKPVFLMVRDGAAELKDASALWGKGAIETREILKSQLGNSVKVAAIGQAGENMVVMANLLADNDSSGSGGLGAVMGSKKLKAIVVQGNGPRANVADPEKLRELTSYYNKLKRMPTLSERGGRRPILVPGKVLAGAKMQKRDPCYGCHGRCQEGAIERRLYQADDGTIGKFMCGSALLYQEWAPKYYGEFNDVPFLANKLCDNYGIDALEIIRLMRWLNQCFQTGVITEAGTGMPLSKIGSLEFMDTLLKKISLRQGFGDILAQGMERDSDMMWPRAGANVAGYKIATGNTVPLDPRLYILSGLLHSMEARTPLPQIHEMSRLIVKWVPWAKKVEGAELSNDVLRAIALRMWGSESAVDFSTHEGKAQAAVMLQDRHYADECLVMCEFLWPFTDIDGTKDHVGDPSLESRILSAVIGRECGEEGLYRTGEMVFNLCRAISVRELGEVRDVAPGHWFTSPLKTDYYNAECMAPGKGTEVVSRLGTVMERSHWEKTKAEYYHLRRWDASGVQKKSMLKDLGLTEVAKDLEHRGLVA